MPSKTRRSKKPKDSSGITNQGDSSSRDDNHDVKHANEETVVVDEDSNATDASKADSQEPEPFGKQSAVTSTEPSDLKPDEIENTSGKDVKILSAL